MRMKHLLGVLLAISLRTAATGAVSPGSIAEWDLSGKPITSQAPIYGIFGPAECDGSGAIYFRYMPHAGPPLEAPITRIGTDGSVKTIPIGNIPDIKGDRSLFYFTIGDDGSAHEVIRSTSGGSKSEPAVFYYARFDKDGTLLSKGVFDGEFVPYMLLPLPSGGFFAAGIEKDKTNAKLQRKSLAGVFGDDAKLISEWKTESSIPVSEEESRKGLVNPELQGGVARLGPDGNIYVLVASHPTRIVVMTQRGKVVRELKLNEPIAGGTANDLYVSGNRLLISFYRELSDDSKELRAADGLYDAQTGDLIRAYHRNFPGRAVCLEDGKTLKFLMPIFSSNSMGIGKADVQ